MKLVKGLFYTSVFVAFFFKFDIVLYSGLFGQLGSSYVKAGARAGENTCGSNTCTLNLKKFMRVLYAKFRANKTLVK